MSMTWRWLSIAWLAILLAACAPAETVPDPPMQTAEPGSTIEDTATPPLVTPAPAEPTAPEATAALPEAPRPTLPGELELAPDSPTKSVPKVEIAPMPEGPTAVPPSDPYSLELIEKAKADLTQRTGIPEEEIILQEFQLVTWSDASLGCPQPGMAYAQVPVDGYLIMLRAGLGIYNYHGGGYPDKGPFLCESGIGTKIIVPPPADSIDK